MGRETEKVRTGFYIETEMLETADGLLAAANVRSRNEFVNEALKFYCGYLKSRKAEDYLLQSLSSVLTPCRKNSILNLESTGNSSQSYRWRLPRP